MQERTVGTEAEGGDQACDARIAGVGAVEEGASRVSKRVRGKTHSKYAMVTSGKIRMSSLRTSWLIS